MLNLADFDSAVRAVKAAPDAQTAERIYGDVYFPLAIERMRAEAEPCSLLILTVGSQPYSVALSLARSPSERVWAIHTNESTESLTTAAQLASVDAPRITRRSVDKASAVQVYRAIREAVESQATPKREIVINITSGTKAMTAAASSAAGVYGIRQIYLESSHLRDRLYGEERCHVVEHPLQVLGDPDREKAELVFDEGRYESAQPVFQELDDVRAPDYHFQSRVILCRAYAAMDQLRFHEASGLLMACADALERVPRANVVREPLAERSIVRRLRDQSSAARGLHDAVSGKAVAVDAATTNLLTRWLLSMARRRRADPELRALLGYRALELGFQRRLATHGIDTEHPDYGGRSSLLEDYNRIAGEDGRDLLAQLPQKVALDAGLTLLWALGDEVITKVSMSRRKIRQLSTLRNKSLFAHGFQSLSERDLADFDKAVAAVTQAVANADGLPLRDPDDEVDRIRLRPS